MRKVIDFFRRQIFNKEYCLLDVIAATALFIFGVSSQIPLWAFFVVAFGVFVIIQIISLKLGDH